MPEANAYIQTRSQPPLLGRRRQSLGGPVQGPAAGNSVVSYDARGPGAAAPGSDGGGRAQSTTWGGLTRSTPDQRGEARAAYGGGQADGKLTVRERFVMVMRGTSRQGAQESHSGIPNPLEDGPPLPEYLQENRTESWQIGLDHTTQEDNPGPFAVTVQRADGAARDFPGPVNAYANKGAGQAFPLGNQGDPWTPVMGPPIGLYREYGVRGRTGVHGPEPKTFALAGDGSGLRTGTLISPGAPEDGPQKIRGGPPHGRHSPTVQARKQTMARQAAIPQQRPGRNDRPSNSRIAGQSYNQMVVHEGSAAVNQTPRLPEPGRHAGINSRFLPRR